MPSPRAVDPEPNVVPPESAAAIRAFVFERRDRPVIAPRDAVAMLLDTGHGARLDEGVRKARLLTWVKQVLRRLRKQGWLSSRTAAEWLPTEELRRCQAVEALTGNASRIRQRRETPAEPPPLPPVESWGVFVERWVFEHRNEVFGTGDIVADMLRRGFGDGDPRTRMEEARRIAEDELGTLKEEFLLERIGDDWQPSELLREWPSA